MAKTTRPGDFAPVRMKKDLLLWLKVESAKRGKYLYEWLEEAIAKGLDGKRPWQNMKEEK